MKQLILLCSFLVMIVGGLIWASPRIFPEKQDRAALFQLAEIKRGQIFSRITTTGTVNPIASVTVSTQVSGTITELPVDVNSQLKEGDLIARLDQDLFRAEAMQAQAQLEDALANLAKEKAGVRMQKDQIAADIAENKASFGNLEEKFKRSSELFRRELISRDQFDSAKADWEMARARYQESAARVDETKIKDADIKVAEAQVKKARAVLRLAQVKLDRSVIRAPVSGVVIMKNVEAGQTVAASLQSPPLVTIADLSTMKVDAWVDEADIGKVKTGQEVEFQVDSYPDRTFRGEVVTIYPSPQIQNNVVTYDTEIHVRNEDLALKPGMTANVTIILAKKDDVLIAPHAALRIRRSEVRQVYPEVDEGRRRRGERRSDEERAERRRQQFLEGRGRVWVLKEGKPQRIRIRFGASDDSHMEIVEGLEQGEQLIVGVLTEALEEQAASGGGRASWIRRRILGGF